MKIYVHIGLQKTGTTTLQSDIFPKLKTVGFSGRTAREFGGSSKIYYQLCEYCFAPKADTALLLKLVAGIGEALKTKELLISEEWFSSDYDGFYYGSGCCWQEKLKRLGVVLRGLNAVVLISERDVSSALFSIYCQNMQRAKAMNYGSFSNFYRSVNDAKAYRNKYLKSVIETNITCRIESLPFDMLKKDSQGYMALLSGIFSESISADYGDRNNLKKKSSHGTVIKQDNRITMLIRSLSRMLPYFLLKVIKSKLNINLHSINSIFKKEVVVTRPTQIEIEEIRLLYKND